MPGEGHSKVPSLIDLVFEAMEDRAWQTFEDGSMNPVGTAAAAGLGNSGKDLCF